MITLTTNNLPYYKKQAILYNYREHLISARYIDEKIDNWLKKHTFLSCFIPKFILYTYALSSVLWHLFWANRIIKQQFANIESMKIIDLILKGDKGPLNSKLYNVDSAIIQLSKETFQCKNYKIDENLRNTLTPSWAIFKREDRDREQESMLERAHALFKKYLESIKTKPANEKNVASLVKFWLARKIGNFDVSQIYPIFNEYKIHLMPKKEKAEEVIKTFIAALDVIPELTELVQSFQFLHGCENSYSEGYLVPKVVIHLKPGEENMQKAIKLLNCYLVDHINFGTNTIPRFNKKVNNLIFYSNGDSALKFEALKAGVFSTWFTKDGAFFSNTIAIKAELEKTFNEESLIE